MALESDVAVIQSQGSRTKTVWITTKKISNLELYRLIKERLTIVDRSLFRALLLPIVKLSRGTRFDGNAVVNDKTTYVQDSSEVSFPLSLKEKQRLPKLLQEMNLTSSRGYVCLVVRDELHSLEEVSIESATSSAYRNSPIHDYEATILYLISQGFSVIRMGRLAHPGNFEIENYFDYSNSMHRTDANDLLLMANCEFVISTLSGIDEIATLFRRPVYLVNYLPVGGFRLSRLRPIVLPKGLRDARTLEKLTLNEIVARGIWEANDSRMYAEANVEIVNCHPNVIRDFTKQVVTHYLEGAECADNCRSSYVRNFFIYAKDVQPEIAHKAPEISNLWLNY